VLGLGVAGAPWLADGVVGLQGAQDLAPRSGQYVVAGVLSVAVGLCAPWLLISRP
jgi:hypothetical protein